MAVLPRIRLGVIDDARRRQRRRRLVFATAAVVAVAAAAVALDPFASDRPATTSPANFVAPGKVFSQSPYMGVSCSAPNSTACDDIGLAVWLRRPALAVKAEIRGRWFSLDDRQWSGPVHRGGRKMFAGFLHHAGLRRDFALPAHWEGQPPRNPVARVRVDYGHGAAVETRVRVSLSAGWG